MSSDDRRFARQQNQVPENEVDDEFGDFEGFDGAALDSIPAAAGPSPWATFPDLLPVQTSPAAATGNDEPSSLQMARGVETHDHEPWLSVASGGCQRPSAEMLPNAHDGTHGHFTPPRTINPPDVSLSACQPTYNSVGSEQACSSGLCHAQGGDEIPAQVGNQLASLQRQVVTLLQQKHQLQQQLDQLAREKQQVQHHLSTSQAENTHLRTQVVDFQQQQLVHLSSNSNSTHNQDIVPMLQQIQDAIAQINDTHTRETNGLREAVNETMVCVEKKTSALEEQMSELGSKLEQQQLHPAEDSGRLETIVTNVVQDCFNQNLDTLSRIVASSLSEVVQNQVSPTRDGALQHFRLELQRHVDQTRRLLERERQQNLLSLAQALQAALKQFSATIEPTVNDHDASGDEKS